MDIIQTILPIFIVIVLGWLCCRGGFMPAVFVGPANRLVYFLAIPAMIFRSIAGSSLKTHFEVKVLLLTLTALLATALLAWGLTCVRAFDGPAHRGSFIQAAFHGNLGYIGLAVAYYMMGPVGLAHASILAGFVMIVHNLMGVLVLSYHAAEQPTTSRRRLMAGQIIKNPVIVACMAGILFSLSGLPMPGMLDRVLAIVASMALPLALLIIGASLSFREFSGHFYSVAGASMIKLVFMPAMGLLLYRLAGLAPEAYLPGLILLAAPTATVAYVMALALKGDADFTVAVISLSTLLSLISFTFWIYVGSQVLF